jgi:quinone-modifying oxidoreductase subunit QmoA
MASLKQARYIREMNENSHATLFYIDIRTVGRLEKFYYNMLEDPGVSFVKGKVAKVNENRDSQNLVLEVEDTLAGEKPEVEFDLVVLATGIVPNTADVPIPYELQYDQYGFIDGSTDIEGIYAAGCAKHPCDVSRTTKESTAAVMKAIECLNGGE